MAERATTVQLEDLTYAVAAGWLEDVLDFEDGQPFVLRPIDRLMLRHIVQLLKDAQLQEVA